MSIDSPWTTDTRVRDRNLKKGLLDPKDLEKHLKDLPDCADKCETIVLAQPALESDGEDELSMAASVPTPQPATADTGDGLPHIDFATFVVSLGHSARVDLGDAPQADGVIARHLPLARQTIDILALLQEKTKGNLTGAEETLLTQVLNDLRMRFVEVSQTT